jgi:hypothetical protein
MAALLLALTPSAAPASLVADLPPTYELPTADTAWDYQIGGARPVPDHVGIVSRDRNDAPAGDYAICYVNAFQTQPDEAGFWRSPSRRDLILRRANGTPVQDSAWGENLLDTSSAGKRSRLTDLVETWVEGCATAGYQAVEYDNLDSWTRSGRRLSRADNLAYARLLNDAAHRHGLASAQKNASEIAELGPGLGFDFAVVEECARWRECAVYADAYDDRALLVEYDDAGYRTACRRIGDRVSVIRRDRNVTPNGPYRTC